VCVFIARKKFPVVFLREDESSTGAVTRQPLHCDVSFSFDERNAKGGRELCMTREEPGRHFTQMKQQYFNVTLCTRTFKINSSNYVVFTSHIAATIAEAPS
jgi:hypothetical protein